MIIINKFERSTDNIFFKYKNNEFVLGSTDGDEYFYFCQLIIQIYDILIKGNLIQIENLIKLNFI